MTHLTPIAELPLGTGLVVAGLAHDLALGGALVLGEASIVGVDAARAALLHALVAAADRALAPLAVAPVRVLAGPDAGLSLRGTLLLVAEVRENRSGGHVAAAQQHLHAPELHVERARAAVARALGARVRDLSPSGGRRRGFLFLTFYWCVCKTRTIRTFVFSTKFARNLMQTFITSDIVLLYFLGSQVYCAQTQVCRIDHMFSDSFSHHISFNRLPRGFFPKTIIFQNPFASNPLNKKPIHRRETPYSLESAVSIARALLLARLPRVGAVIVVQDILGLDVATDGAPVARTLAGSIAVCPVAHYPGGLPVQNVLRHGVLVHDLRRVQLTRA